MKKQTIAHKKLSNSENTIAKLNFSNRKKNTKKVQIQDKKFEKSFKNLLKVTFKTLLQNYTQEKPFQTFKTLKKQTFGKLYFSNETLPLNLKTSNKLLLIF